MKSCVLRRQKLYFPHCFLLIHQRIMNCYSRCTNEMTNDDSGKRNIRKRNIRTCVRSRVVKTIIKYCCKRVVKIFFIYLP